MLGGVVLTPETFKGLDHSKHMKVVTHQVCPCNWSLLPSTVIDALTCVLLHVCDNHMYLSIPEIPRSATPSSMNTTSTGLLCLSVCALVHFIFSRSCELTHVAAATHQHQLCITYTYCNVIQVPNQLIQSLIRTQARSKGLVKGHTCCDTITHKNPG